MNMNEWSWSCMSTMSNDVQISNEIDSKRIEIRK